MIQKKGILIMDIKDIYNIDDIKKSLDGEELIMRKIYILKEAVSSEELVRDKYFSWLNILRRQQVKEFYRKQQQIIENKEIIKTFELPYTKPISDSKMGVVAGTDISTPILYDIENYEISAHFCETVTTNGLNDCFCNLDRTNIISFSHEDRKVVLTAVRRGEAVRLRQKCKQIDPHSFMFITNTSEIIGKGFRAD